MQPNEIIGRQRELFSGDAGRHESSLRAALDGARILVFGGAGSIGKEAVAQIFRRKAAALHVIDLSENNLVELVRNLRSSMNSGARESRFLPLDMAGVETSAFLASQKPYDYVLNFAAMKHVRSEKDAYSLMRMVKVNVLDMVATLARAREARARKYFAVSTDKAKNPANLMGATKRIMEDALFEQEGIPLAVSTARVANVAFSDGSLLHGFRQRLSCRQPISAPRDIHRYFVTGEEAGRICLLSLVLGRHREIFFPKFEAGTGPIALSEVARRFLETQGYEAVALDSEEAARAETQELVARGKWPCYFFDSDTSGEKAIEEFYSEEDDIDWDRFADIGVIRCSMPGEASRGRIRSFLGTIASLRDQGRWLKEDIVQAIQAACPELAHLDTGRFLDERM